MATTSWKCIGGPWVRRKQKNPHQTSFNYQWDEQEKTPWLCCNLSVAVALNVLFTTNGMCANNNTHVYVTQTSNNRVIMACDLLLLATTVWSFAYLLLGLSVPQQQDKIGSIRHFRINNNPKQSIRPAQCKKYFLILFYTSNPASLNDWYNFLWAPRKHNDLCRLKLIS